MEDYRDIITTERAKQSLTFKELAKLSGVSVPTILNYEKGKKIRLCLVFKLLKALGVEK